jgi:hypothetical protein
MFQEAPMKGLFLTLVALFAIGAAVPEIEGQFHAVEQPSSRDLTGQVITKGDQPLTDAVVYLKNTKTLTV